MFRSEKDFILRAIEELARFLAAALRRALQLEEAGQHEQALQELGEAYRELFGLDGRFLHLMSAEQVAQALGHPERLRLLAQLLDAEAGIRDASGDPARAQILRTKATEVRARADGYTLH